MQWILGHNAGQPVSSTPAGLKQELQSLWCRERFSTCRYTCVVHKEEEDRDEQEDGKLN